MASCMGCLAGCAQLVMRAVVFFSCLLLLILSAAKHFSSEEEPPIGREDFGIDLGASSVMPTWHYRVLLRTCALLGLYGSCTRDPRSLKLFAILLTLLALWPAYAAYELGPNNEQFISKLNQSLTDDFEDYTWPPGTNPATRRWDYVQGAYRCCGLRNSSEWSHQRNRPKQLASKLLPRSCCYFTIDDLCLTENAHLSSCLDNYKKVLYVFSSGAKAVASLLVLNAMFAHLIIDRKSSRDEAACLCPL